MIQHNFKTKCHDLPALFADVNKFSRFMRNLEKQAIIDPLRYDPQKYLGDGFEFFVEVFLSLHPADNRVGVYNYIPIQENDNGVDGNGVELHKGKSKIKCDKNFFKNYSNESCYWAGFIMADGNLRLNRNSLQIKLAKIDKSHLYSFLKVIKCDDYNLVKEYDDYVSLTISLDEFKKDLFDNFGVSPKKTYICDLHLGIPKNMLKHFIRGYFDGDGSITKTTVISINFVGTKMLLSKFSEYFKTDLNVVLKSKNDVPPIQLLKNNNIIGTISYSGKNVIKIMDNFYNEFCENCFLIRKLEKYKQLKKEYETR